MKTATRFQPSCEPLENRCLLTTGLTASLSPTGVLTVTGTANNDRIVVLQNPSNDRIMVRDNLGVGTDTRVGKEAGELVPISVNGQVREYVAAGQVALIKVCAGAGNDKVNLNYVDTFNGPPRSLAVQVDSEVHGGSGNDTLVGGAGHTEIWGDGGNDALYGVSAAGIRNILHGGDGNDCLQGGAGINRLYGGDGDDILKGGSGSNYLSGGCGLDTFHGGKGPNTYHDEFTGVYSGGVDYRSIYEGRASDADAFVAALTAVARQSPDSLEHVSADYCVPLFWNGHLEIQHVRFDGTWNDHDPMPSLDAQGRVTGESWVLVYWEAFNQFLQAHYLKPAEQQSHRTIPDVFNALVGNSSTIQGTMAMANDLALHFNEGQGAVVQTKGTLTTGGTTAGLAACTRYVVVNAVSNPQTGITMVTLRSLGTRPGQIVEITMELNALVKNLQGVFEAGC